MKNRALLEMSVETLDAAIAAVRGGADRIELCEDLSVGGVTPSMTLMREARRRIAAPIFAMIRPRGGDFCYSAQEFEQMKKSVGAARSEGMDGVVLGILTSRGRVNIEQSSDLIRLARPLPVTFHRAFDELGDLERALEDVIATGATRLLTSGGEPSAEEGRSALSRLVKQSGGRILILPGGGIRPNNLSRIARATRAAEFHSGLSNLLPYPRQEHGKFEEGVRELVRVLEKEARNLEPAPSAS